MKKKYIFLTKKNKKKKKFFLITSIIIIVIFSFFYFLKISKKISFLIPLNSNHFYIVPEDKGGRKIPNQNKKGLHLSYKGELNLSILNDPKFKFSIQITSSNDYLYVKNRRSYFLNQSNSLFLSEDLYIGLFNTKLGIEYVLLYKNFNLRSEALEYCTKYTNFLDKCLVVNVQNLE